MKNASIRIAALIGIIALLAATPAERRLVHTLSVRIAQKLPASSSTFCRQVDQGSIEFSGDGHIARFTPPALECQQ
ncbi:MAG TPA: hypothetical protein VMS32_08365 [Verrucomicrobiae bacterium]|jgi:hypothetical protein|nr:hypothetical protein [Verrucomicrobiae bacterium]